MKPIAGTILAALFVAVPACWAQKWELGGEGGVGFPSGLTVSNSVGNATAGFANGGAFGILLVQNLYPRISGEFCYNYQFSDLRISRSGESAAFKGNTQSIHYDILFHFRSSRERRLRPFFAVGGGMRDFRGVGAETSYQPLSNFALLTQTSQWTPVVTLGAGIKYAITRRLVFRAEVRDYFSRFPTQVIAPAPGARLSGWLNDLVPMAGITFGF
jgi:hypothetical protein